MTVTLRKKADELMTALTADERIELADLLYDSAPIESPEVIEKAWADEIKRRLDDYEAGKTVTYTSEEVHERMTQVLNEARQARASRNH